jgi:hypothetical protein
MTYNGQPKADALFSNIEAFASLYSNDALNEIVSAKDVRSQLQKMWDVVSDGKGIPLQLPSADNKTANEYLQLIRGLVDKSKNPIIKKLYAATPFAQQIVESDNNNFGTTDNGVANNNDDQIVGDNVDDDVQVDIDDDDDGDGDGDIASVHDNDDDDGNTVHDYDDEIDEVSGKRVEKKKAEKGQAIPLSPADMLAIGIGQNSSLVEVDSATLREYLTLVKAAKIPTDRIELVRMASAYNQPSSKNLVVRSLDIIDNFPGKATSLVAAVADYNKQKEDTIKHLKTAMKQFFEHLIKVMESNMFTHAQRTSLEKCKTSLQQVIDNIDAHVERTIRNAKAEPRVPKNKRSFAMNLLTAAGATALIGGSVAMLVQNQNKSQAESKTKKKSEEDGQATSSPL